VRLGAFTRRSRPVGRPLSVRASGARSSSALAAFVVAGALAWGLAGCTSSTTPQPVVTKTTAAVPSSAPSSPSAAVTPALRLPSERGPRPEAEGKTTLDSRGQVTTYTVVAGDRGQAILARFDVNYSLLENSSGGRLDDPDTLFPGEVIRFHPFEG
jgi:hypothetical protein